MKSAVVESFPTRRQPGAYVFLTLMVLIGSTTATAAKFAVRDLPADFLPLVRFGLSGLCMLMLVGPAAVWRVWHTDRIRLLIAAALSIPINQFFFLNGTRLALTSHVAFLYAATPLVVLLLATALGQERLSLGRLIGVLITMAGAVVLTLGGRSNVTPASANALRGDLLLIGAVLSWGAYLTVNKPLVERQGALATLGATFLTGCLLQMPIAIRALIREHEALATASAQAWYGLAYLSLFVTIVAFACQNQALKSLDATQVATVGNAAPLLTVLWGVWLLGETVSAELVVGGTLILGGILWTNRADQVPVPQVALQACGEPEAG